MTVKIALSVHAFYPDLFASMLRRIEGLPDGHKLYVTTNPEHEDFVRGALAGTHRPYSLRTAENRGRDILPFLETLPELRADGVDAVIKIHTKKSLHRHDGRRWLEDILSQLLDPRFVRRAEEALVAAPSLGMIGPQGHYLSASTFFGANAARIREIGARLGLSEPEILAQGFFGGTMFMARISAFDPLLGLGLTRDDFEPEAGQKDGTLAHALERAMTLSVRAQGQWIASADNLTSPASTEEKYSFAKSYRASAGPLGRLQDLGRRVERSVRHFVRSGGA